MGIQSATGRYRMAEGNLLPKFSPTARAASPSSTVKAESAKLVTRLQMENQMAVQPGRTESNQLSISKALGRALGFFLKCGNSMFTTCAAAGSLVKGTLKKVKPRLNWKSRPFRTEAEKIKLIKPAMQGELSLDKIKVVRNDLSDTDLEIVSVTDVERSKSVEPLAVLVNQGDLTGKPWGRLTPRVFGARQTPV